VAPEVVELVVVVVVVVDVYQEATRIQKRIQVCDKKESFNKREAAADHLLSSACSSAIFGSRQRRRHFIAETLVEPMLSRQLCSNPHCKRTSPGDGPTCRWHVRNYGSDKEPKHVTLCNACKINFDQVSMYTVRVLQKTLGTKQTL
jgi:hypothetical protein